MSWIRVRSGSLWTGAIAHASINLFNQGFFAPLTSSRGGITAYAIDESGVVLPIVLFGTAIFFWTRRGSLNGIKATERVAPATAALPLMPGHP